MSSGSMVIEGLLTTRAPDGRCHAAAMGPIVRSPHHVLLRPFRNTRTLAHLRDTREAVFHVVDDVLIIARVVTGHELAPEEVTPATRVQGWVWRGACAAWELAVKQEEPGDELRAAICCDVVFRHQLKPFDGFNRARHAILELAIAATRLHILPRSDVEATLALARKLTHKTGGPREREALSTLERYISERYLKQS